MKTSRLKTSTSDKLRFEIHSASQKWYMKANHQVEATRWIQVLQRNIGWYNKRDPAGSDADSFVSGKLVPFDAASTSNVSKSFLRSRSSYQTNSAPSIDHGSGEPSNGGGNVREQSEEEDVHSDGMESKAPSGGDDVPPHKAELELQYNAATAQMEITADLLSALSNCPPSSPKAQETHGALQDSYAQVQALYHEYVRMVQEREAWFKARIVREKERAGMWEESLQVVVREGEVLEEQLKKTLRGRMENRKSRRFSMIPDAARIEGLDTFGLSTIKARPKTISASPTSEPKAITPPAIQYATYTEPVPLSVPPPAQASTDDEDDEEDEFFDAIESNNLPYLVVSAPLASPMKLDHTPELGSWVDLRQYQGYQHPRERLSITADDRPPVSLWAVLKGSIGKDLTKISFPVFFSASYPAIP